MTVIEAVRGWLKTCPLLEDERLNIDFLPIEAQSYSVEAVPGRGTIEKYMDGSAIKQFLFVIASREFSGDDLAQNADNLQFYEALADWVERQNHRPKHLPDLGEGRDARKIEVTTPGYLFYSDDQGTARYQIQMALTYTERGARL